MNTLKSELATFSKPSDLKPMLAAAPPCLSIYLPLSKASRQGLNPSYKQNALRWKERVHGLQERVGQWGSGARELLSSLENWDAVAPESLENGSSREGSIAVFRSPDVFQVALLDKETPERAVIGPHFYLRPLLSELVRDRQFYLLAVSRKNARLLHCTTRAANEVAFPRDTKTDFDEWMNMAKPDHTAVDNAVTGARQGVSSPNALAPKGSDDEARVEYLSHYFKQIDRGVNEILRGKTEPLVLCGVEYENAIYREISRYPHLAIDEVRGAPNGLKSGEMHARALEALDAGYQRKVGAVLDEWNHRAGGGASSHLKECVTAAHDGRVVKLLISESQEQTGTFDEATHTVKGRETGTTGDEDLVNDAAVQTLLHAGEVIVVPAKSMPHGAPLAAIFRY